MEPKRNSNIHLRPRFKMGFDKDSNQLIEKFRDNLKDSECKYCSKIVDGHIIIDVPVEENHFWSPQLNIEVEQVTEKKSVVKGLFGPKPQVWTLFMFIHFAVAFAFIGFSIMAYVKYLVKESYTFSLIMVIALPVFWFILYFLGRMGRRKGNHQMNELYNFMMKTLDKKLEG